MIRVIAAASCSNQTRRPPGRKWYERRWSHCSRHCYFALLLRFPQHRLLYVNCSPAVFPLCAQDTSLITVPTVVEPVTKGSVKGQMVSPGWPGNTMGAQSQVDNTFYESNMVTSDTQEFYSGRYDSQYGQGGYLVSSGANIDNQHLAQNSGFLHNWQTNGRYLQQVKCFTALAAVT